METLDQRVNNIKEVLMMLINLLENNATNADALKKTLSLFDVITDEVVMEELVLEVSKMLDSTLQELKDSEERIKRKRFQANEQVDRHQDSLESEELLATF